VYEAAGGSEGLLRLAQAWHRRVMGDEIVSHAFSHGFHPQHSERLAAYWAEALGGPTTYSGSYGDETSVVRTHSGNGPHEEMDRRAIACFDQALEDVGPKRGRTGLASAARLLRLGYHDDHVALPRVFRRCPRGLDHPTMVMGRATALSRCSPADPPAHSARSQHPRRGCRWVKT
jgi:truncated hemoglobin YjbI